MTMRVRDWQPLFFEALRNSGNVRAACLAAGIGRTIVYKRRHTDTAFRARWDEALAEATDVLDAEARRRALAGSDPLLMFLLRAHRPEVYREALDVRLELRREAEMVAGRTGRTVDEVLEAAERRAAELGKRR
jgi:hypothetical protein